MKMAGYSAHTVRKECTQCLLHPIQYDQNAVEDFVFIDVAEVIDSMRVLESPELL